MKLESVTIKNFRGYAQEITIPIDSGLTAGPTHTLFRNFKDFGEVGRIPA